MKVLSHKQKGAAVIGGAMLFNLLTQRFLQIFRVRALNARHQQYQTVIVLSFEPIQYDLLRGLMIVAFDQVARHFYLQSGLLTRFTALAGPPAF